MVWQAAENSVSEAMLEVDILAIDVTELAKPLREGGHIIGVTGWRSWKEYPYSPDLRAGWLRASRERPRCRRATEERDEFPPLHVRPQLRTRHRIDSIEGFERG